MKKFAKWLIRLVVLLLLALLAAYFVLPWKALLEKKITAAIEKKGISPVSLHLESIGRNGATLTQVSLGEPPLTLHQLTLDYQWRALMNGSIEAVTLHGLVVAANEGESGWQISGLDALTKQESQPPSTTVIPSSRAELAVLPLSHITIADSSLRATAKQWQAELPITLELKKANAITLKLASSAIIASMGKDALTTGALTLNLTLDETSQQWHGDWALADIAITSESIALPLLQAAGELTLTADSIALKGKISDASNAYHAAFAVDYSLSKPDSSRAVISTLGMPWGGGSVGASNIQLPIGKKKATTLTLNVKQVPIASLLQALTNDSATATGVVSGMLPLTIRADGKITPGKGSLRAEEPGIINMSPDSIPGDNQQVTLVREVLKNLHYSLLSLDLDTGEDGGLSVTLAVEGNNPDVEKGRPVKLKVHLSGDLLDLITQNIKLMTDPTQFIKQESHETD